MTYRIRNWARFQHYKDRNPPWIKLHVEIVSSADWVLLDDASRLLAIVCMVLAAKNGGEVPDNPEYIRRFAYLKRTPDLEPLVKCGFLEPNGNSAVADASNTLADASTLQAHARPERESDTEKDTDRAVVVDRPRETRAKKRTQIPDGFPDFEALRRAQEFWTQKQRLDLSHSVREEAEQFRDHHLKHGSTMADWPAAWRTWCRNALKFNRVERSSGRESPHKQTARIAAELIAEYEAGNAHGDPHPHDRAGVVVLLEGPGGRPAEGDAQADVRRLGGKN